jgi:NAD(P)-dependent dehydrogenase (short-subunit alcohol dehydrogenase family)
LGIAPHDDDLSAGFDASHFDPTFATNVRAPFFLTAAIAPKMAARGMAAHFGLPGASASGASKAAIVSLTQTWAAEYGPQGVRASTRQVAAA